MIYKDCLLFDLDTLSDDKAILVNRDFIVTDHLSNQLNMMDGILNQSVTNTIIGIQSDGQVRLGSNTQIKGAMYKFEPLKNLYKSHVELLSLKSYMMNSGMYSNNLISTVEENDEILDVYFNVNSDEYKEFEKKFIEKCKGKSLEEVKKIIDEESKKIVGLDKYIHKSKKNKITGAWLIYGKNENKNIYLHLDIKFSHEQENDESIYSELISKFGNKFIDMLKSGK